MTDNLPRQNPGSGDQPSEPTDRQNPHQVKVATGVWPLASPPYRVSLLYVTRFGLTESGPRRLILSAS